MFDLLEDLMDAAARHSDYADVRFVHTRSERLTTRSTFHARPAKPGASGRVALDQVDSAEQEGIGVRVRVKGAWGFAAVAGTGRPDAEAALARALEVAAAQPRAPGAALAPEPPAHGSYANEVARDPFEVSLSEKLGVLAAAEAGLRTAPEVSLTVAGFEALRTRKLFASTEGARCEQVLTECGGGLTAVAVGAEESQVRSYPSSHGGQVSQAGFEHFHSLDLAGHAPRVAAEAAELLQAPACPGGASTVILAGEQLALQIHESIGHAVELDRVLGRETSYAGTSFVPADGIGALRCGSELVNVTASAIDPGGLGSFRWDDEGVEGRAVPIIREGVLRGFLSSRETATEIGLGRSGGSMRAEGFARQPIVRMTNVNLEPGDAGTLDDLIADTEAGILIETNRSWSIDDRRLQFRFEGESAREIRGGELGRLLRNPSYGGVTPRFWAGCDAICSPQSWKLVSLLNCGKGEPGQTMRVSHGVAPARFRDVSIGVA